MLARPADTGIGHAIRTAIIGYFALVVLVSAALLFTTTGVGFDVALAVGAYIAIWGGPGWGGMVAAQKRSDRLDAAEQGTARRGAEETHRDGVWAGEGLPSGMTSDRRHRDRRATKG